ncbi:hypothetical protein [Bartonella refiksaydamii]|uniref:hypothetical protein n=1 Tax=Bartonella refiksaydamii TaxID=2654951 RepID=UPI0012EB8865|nr:hypothetical protein [Bartonella refiksaydamii]
MVEKLKNQNAWWRSSPDSIGGSEEARVELEVYAWRERLKGESGEGVFEARMEKNSQSKSAMRRFSQRGKTKIINKNYPKHITIDPPFENQKCGISIAGALPVFLYQ